MKEFIYLDTSFLNSFMAQKEGGLPTTVTNEQSEEITSGSEDTRGKNSRSYAQLNVDTGAIEIPIFFKSPSGNLVLHGEPGKFFSEKANLSQTEAGKEIISKQLHDNALNEFEKYMQQMGLIKNVNPGSELAVGEYIKMTDSLTIVDFNFFENALDDKLAEIMSSEGKKELDLSIKLIEKSQDLNPKQRKSEIAKLEKKFDQTLKEVKKEFKNIKEILGFFSKILPGNSFVLIGNTISALKDDFLREDSKSLFYKYGGKNSDIKATLIGKVTRKFNILGDTDSQSDYLSAIEQIAGGIDLMFVKMNLSNPDDYVVSPVAIYFG